VHFEQRDVFDIEGGNTCGMAKCRLWLPNAHCHRAVGFQEWQECDMEIEPAMEIFEI
jgi:hypothetical protein